MVSNKKKNNNHIRVGEGNVGDTIKFTGTMFTCMSQVPGAS